jgi:hypothetical protein
LEKIIGSKVEVLNDPLSDDFMNLVEVAASLPDKSLIGITFLNKHCYVPCLAGESEPLLRRSIELKFEILTEIFGWQLLVVDESEFMALKDSEAKQKFIISKI